jgi:hypothetical protein
MKGVVSMKMTKKIFVALLAVCALLTFAACNNGNGDTSTVDSSVADESSTATQESVAVSETVSEESVETVEYTKGAVSNNVYTNEWADMKFELDSTTWKEGSASDYASYESATTDCGLIAGLATEGRQLAIVFENNPKNDTTETYIANVKKGMLAIYSDYVFSESYKKTIAGKEYLCIDATLTQNGVSIYQAFFVTQHDGKFISLAATSITGKEEITSVVEKITTVK